MAENIKDQNLRIEHQNEAIRGRRNDLHSSEVRIPKPKCHLSILNSRVSIGVTVLLEPLDFFCMSFERCPN